MSYILQCVIAYLTKFIFFVVHKITVRLKINVLDLMKYNVIGENCDRVPLLKGSYYSKGEKTSGRK